MGRFRADEAEHYGGSGGAGYFGLKNDKDVAQVRFLYDSYEDVEGYAVHEVEVEGKNRYVNCLRDYDSPMDDCPFCAANKPVRAKLFVPLYNVDEDKVQIWDRGKKFFQKLSSLAARYPDLSSHIFEIERNGKANSTQTTYEIYEVDHDDLTCADLPECGDVLGGLVLDKSADDMGFYLDNGYFPPDEEEEAPVRRRNSRKEKEADVEEDTEVPFDEEEEESDKKASRSTRSSRASSRTSQSRRTPRTSRGRGERF